MEKYTPAEYTAETQDQRALVQELKQEPEIREVFSAMHIPAAELDRHPYRLKRWLDRKKLCRGCISLKNCRQAQRGFVEEPVYDGVLSMELTPCRWLQEKQQKEAHAVHFLVNDLPGNLRTAGFADLKTDKESRAYLQVLQKAITAFMDRRSLYIYGNMGTGKTMIAACAVNDAARKGMKTAFVSMPRLSERITASLRTGEYQTEVQRLCYADFAVFDDIGAENVTDRYRAVLLSILDTRMQEGRMTWFTSNEDFASLKNHYILSMNQADIGDAERVLERIRAIGEPLELIGRDRRNLYSTGKGDFK